MAHSNTPIAVDTSNHTHTPLAFRRADGSRHEFLFDDRTHSLPQPAASLFQDDNNNNNTRRPTATQLPRTVLRPFRRDNGEPAAEIRFIRDTRQSVCRDGVDRSRCSGCRRTVTTTTTTTTTMAAPTSPSTTTPTVPAADATTRAPHRWHMMSPQRVFRDLVMSDVAEPLQPVLRDALLHAFNGTVEVEQQPQKRKAQPKQTAPSHLGRPLLPSSPPTKASVQGDTKTDNHQAPTEFRYFSCLPYEIRRMVWEQALPFRVLLRDDLAPTNYRSVRRVFRPASHTHTIEMLWQSDLFYVCAEARRVVEAAYGGSKGGSPPNAIPLDDDGALPALVRHITSPTRLRSGLDVLYYPWLGAEAIRDHGHVGFGGAGLWVPGRHHEQQSQHHHHHQHHNLHGHSSAGTGTNSRAWMSKYESASPRNRTPSPSSSAAAPITSVPYGYWASQLRLLRLAVSTVALDAAWIDRAHPDIIAWAAGVDLSLEDDDSDDENNDTKKTVAAPTSLQMIVADLLVPVRIRLETTSAGITSAQRRLLQEHIVPQPWLDARSFLRALRESSDQPPSSSAAASSTTSTDPLSTNLNGMDFTVLVDLYDNWRIEELLSLQGNGDGSVDVLNKAALHRCIACTRRAWEARNTEDSHSGGNSWTTKFGPLLGTHLQRLCRPTIVFSVVLSFDDDDM